MTKSTRIGALFAVLMALLGMAVMAWTSSFAQGVAATQSDDQDDEQDASQGLPVGVVFAMTNVTAGNRIVIYRRSSDGTLNRAGRVRTRGLGIGTDLDSQGGLRLSADHRFLYAANAGSDEITVFAVDGTRLNVIQKVDAGDEPVSLTISGNLLLPGIDWRHCEQRSESNLIGLASLRR